VLLRGGLKLPILQLGGQHGLRPSAQTPGLNRTAEIPAVWGVLPAIHCLDFPGWYFSAINRWPEQRLHCCPSFRPSPLHSGQS
jgi:hypothetical protein